MYDNRLVRGQKVFTDQALLTHVTKADVTKSCPNSLEFTRIRCCILPDNTQLQLGSPGVSQLWQAG